MDPKRELKITKGSEVIYQELLSARNLLGAKNQAREIIINHAATKDFVDGRLRWKQGISSVFCLIEKDIPIKAELIPILDSVLVEAESETSAPDTTEYFHISGLYGGVIVCSDDRHADILHHSSWMGQEETTNYDSLQAIDDYNLLLREGHYAGSDFQSEYCFWKAVQLMVIKSNFMWKWDPIPSLEEAKLKYNSATEAYKALESYVGVGAKKYT